MNKQLMLKRSVVAVGLTLASSTVVFAQEAAVPDTTQKVYVTGSNIKRSDKEGSSPVQIINQKQIAATGAATVADLLHSLPAFGTGTSLDITDGGFSKGASTASLRGFGSAATLVLLNGRRITASAYADPNQGKATVYDLNTIPISAIERVEILKDGASAVYGSDAVAGVVNFITKSDFKGGELSVNVNANDNREFGRHGVSGAFGKGDINNDRYNVLVSFDLAKRNSTKIADENDIEKDMYAFVNGRLNPFSSNLSSSPFFYRERTPGGKNFANSLALKNDVINKLDCPADQQLVGDKDAHNLSPTSTLIGRRFCNFNLDQFAEAQSAGKDANLLSRVTFQINPNTTWFTEAMYSRQERNYLGAPRSIQSTSPTTVFTLNGADSFQLILPVGHPDNPFPTSRAAAGFRFVNSIGGSENVNKSVRFLTGLKGSFGNWDWETGLLYNKSERHETYRGMLYKPTISRIMTENRTIAATIADPTSTTNVDNFNFASITQFDAKVNGTLGQLAGGDIGLALGMEARNEKIGLTPDEKTQRGDVIGLANSALDGQRRVYSAFAELRTPFTKGFEMDYAARYDHYPTVHSLVPKVGAKWTLTDTVTLRSSLGRSFVAPALSQVSPGGVQSFTTITDSIRCPDGVNPVPGADKVDCAKGISSLSGSTPGLQPEKGRSFSFGAILAPMKNVDVLVDYYFIRKTNETALLSAQYVVDHQDLFPGKVIRDNNPANLIIGADGKPIPNSGPISAVNRSFVNQGATETSGLDFEVGVRNKVGDFNVNTKLDWSYVLTYKRAERPGDTEHNLAGTNGGIADWATSVGSIPKNRASLSSSWNMGDHTITGTIDYVGNVSLLRRYDNDVTYPQPYCYYGTGQPSTAYQLGGLPRYSIVMNGACEIISWTTLGMSYSYTGFKNWTLALNIRNILDTPAPYAPGSATTGFDSQLHNGYGRYWRGTATYRF